MTHLLDIDDLKKSDITSILKFAKEIKQSKIGGKTPYLELLPIKLKLADYYSKNKNFILDFKLVIITIVSIILPGFASRYLIIPFIYNEIPEVKSFINKYLS